MKNKENFAKEILDIACKGYPFSVTKSGEITFCDCFKCDMCKFYVPADYKSCRIRRYEWSELEYVEKHTITSKEKKFLDLLLPNYKYIAREKNGFLLVYTEKPIKILETWGLANCASMNMFDIKFDFIKWEDEEPWSIEDLKNLEVRDDGKSNG